MTGLRGVDLVERVRSRMASDGALAVPDALRADLAGAGSGSVVDSVVLAGLQRDVDAELRGAGVLEPLLALPGVTDVLVNAPDEVWIDRGNGMERAAVWFADDAAVRRLAQRLAGSTGRRLDDAMPFVDTVLPDGTRLHAALPPLCDHTVISLRVLARTPLDLEALVVRDAMPALLADALRAVIAARVAFVVTGGTGSGKTTLLAALLGAASHRERLLVIEDAPELAIAHPHVVRLLTRGANVEGAGEVGLRDLVRQALRMRPDRLVVGEFRGAEMIELLVAMNTGHEGSAATVHANSAADVPARFAALGALGGLPSAAVTSLVASAVDLVVHLRRQRDGRRAVEELGLIERHVDDLAVRPVWTRVAGTVPDGWRRLAELVEAGGGALC